MRSTGTSFNFQAEYTEAVSRFSSS